MATNTVAQQQPTQKEEMWFIQLAKSKIVRAFAVSCELVLFLGGLWVTLTVNEPDAVSWAIGPIVINSIVMTAMGWAVDAALGESWLHVVIQHVKQEKSMENWSKAVAIGISLLFAANVVYALVARDADKTASQQSGMNATTIILFVLTALRIFIGFTYITVRECQGWITRHKEEGTQAQQGTPQAPALDVEKIVNEALAKQANDQAQVMADLKAELAEVKKAASLPQILPPPIDLVQAAKDEIFRQMEEHFQAFSQQMETQFRQSIVVSQVEILPENADTIQAKRLPEKASSGNEFRQTIQAKRSGTRPNTQAMKRTAKMSSQAEQNVIHLVPANASREELIAEAKRLHDVEGLSSYAIGEKLGKSAKTVQSWLSKDKDQAESEVREAAN